MTKVKNCGKKPPNERELNASKANPGAIAPIIKSITNHIITTVS